MAITMSVTYLYPIYTTQPVVKPGLTTVLNEQLNCSFKRTAVRSTGLTTGCIHDTAGCETVCQTGLTTG